MDEGWEEEREFTQEYKDACSGGYTHHCDYGDNFTDVYVCQLLNYTLYMQFSLYQLYFNKAIKKHSLLSYDQERAKKRKLLCST